jgi:diacylglycerol kinase family enzyme
MDVARGPVILIVSPHAGRMTGGDPTVYVADALRRTGVAVGRVLEVSALDEAAPQGTAWRAEGFAAAVVAGGDGTVGAVATHVAGTDLPLGILPLGTANDVARSLEIPQDLAGACAVVAEGVTGAIDIGEARPGATEPGAPDVIAAAEAAGAETPAVIRMEERAWRGAYFLHALTLGLNVEFARLATDAARRRLWGPLNYPAAAIEALARLRPLPTTVRLEGVTASAYGMRMPGPSGPDEAAGDGLRVTENATTRIIAGNMIQLAAIVTPVFGGAANLRMPDVSLSDHLLDFVVIEALAPYHLRTLVERLGAGPPDIPDAVGSALAPPGAPQPLELPGLWRFKARRAVIERPPEVDVTLDGEVRARTPLEMRCVPAGLTVLLPRARAGEVLGG